MRPTLLLLAAAGLASAALTPAFADHARRSHAKHFVPKPRLDRDCVPINGRYGYYGNPWCDTGSSRPPDIDFRERQRLRQR